jgi:hypothetical protein
LPSGKKHLLRFPFNPAEEGRVFPHQPYINLDQAVKADVLERLVANDRDVIRVLFPLQGFYGKNGDTVESAGVIMPPKYYRIRMNANLRKRRQRTETP